MTYDNMIEVVGDTANNPSDKIEIVSRKKNGLHEGRLPQRFRQDAFVPGKKNESCSWRATKTQILVKQRVPDQQRQAGFGLRRRVRIGLSATVFRRLRV
jgi:hypothetical protein